MIDLSANFFWRGDCLSSLQLLNVNPQIKSVCDPAYGGDPLNARCVAGAGTRLMDAAFQNAGIGSGRFVQIYEYSSNNRSMYDGVNFQVKRRMTRRFGFQASYVLSSSRSWGGFPVASYGGSGIAVTPEQQFASNEFARTNFDERHRITLSGVFLLPGGIQLSPIFWASSGKPYSLLAGSDVNGDGRVTIDRACVGTTVDNALTDVAAATQPGCTMLKPNTLTGKPFIQMNLRAGKVINLGERAKVVLVRRVLQPLQPRQLL